MIGRYVTHMRIAIVGVTGLVGQMTMRILEERAVKVSEFIPVASARSVGKEIEWNGKRHVVKSLEWALDAAPDIAFFAAGSGVALEWAPRFAQAGTYVIDKSSAYRMQDDVPLVIPEINQHTITDNTKIIASPNCSTSQLVLALHPLQERYGLSRVIVSTYQSMSGSGTSALEQYKAEQAGEADPPRVYSQQIYDNCIPHCDDFSTDDYTKEELKLIHETRKILDLPDLPITATAVRVPVSVGHSESVSVSLQKEFSLAEVKECLAAMSGVDILDDISQNMYPTALQSRGKDTTFVGRLRIDRSHENSLHMWVVSDNLRKGAATNAVQIAEVLERRMTVSL